MYNGTVKIREPRCAAAPGSDRAMSAPHEAEATRTRRFPHDRSTPDLSRVENQSALLSEGGRVVPLFIVFSALRISQAALC